MDSRNLLHGRHEGASSVIGFVGVSALHDLETSHLHGVRETRADQINFFGASNKGLACVGIHGSATDLLHPRNHVLLGLLFPGAVDSAKTHVAEILQPLKVGHGDSSRVQKHVGDDDFAVLVEDVVSSRSDGSVGAFSNQLGLDVARVGVVDLSLKSGGNQNVALFLQHGSASFDHLFQR